MIARQFNVEALGLLDAEADGDLDVLIDNAGKIELWVNDGGGGLARTLLPGRPAIEPDNAEYLAVADLDDDGDVDFALRVEGGPDVFLNLGDGSFASTLELVVDGTDKGDFNFCDLDNDGALDLVVTDFADRGANAVWRQLSPGVFVPGASLLPTNPSVGAAACGDLDGDGWEDLVFGVEGNPDGGPPGPLTDAIFLNQRDGGFTRLLVPGLGSGPTVAVLLHDDDRDGDLDVFLHHEPFSELWRNDDGPQSTLLVRALHAQAARPRDALGASAVLQRCDGTRLSGRRHLSGGTGRGTFPEPVMRFGLGTISEPVVVVRVRFVGGRLVRRALRLSGSQAMTVTDTDVDDLSACGGPGDGGVDGGPGLDAGAPADAGPSSDGGASDSGVADDGGTLDGGPTDAGLRAPSELVASCNQRLAVLVGSGIPVTVSAREGTLPPGLDVSTQDGRITWFPTPADVGTWKLLVDDGRTRRALDLKVECVARDEAVGCGCSAPAPLGLAALGLWLAVRVGRPRRRRGDSVSSSAS
ncbi:MAG: VCBS repeat-containing protein [Myxococcaceae bacterium]|nr:VCBS repeat-containing protein [Myxococcaceae bacterium]